MAKMVIRDETSKMKLLKEMKLQNVGIDTFNGIKRIRRDRAKFCLRCRGCLNVADPEAKLATISRASRSRLKIKRGMESKKWVINGRWFESD